MEAVAPDTKPKTCSQCGQVGHYRPTCPELRETQDERIAAIAALRLELDALDSDIADYERVVGHAQKLLDTRRERRAVVNAEIARMRGAR